MRGKESNTHKHLNTWRKNKQKSEINLILVDITLRKCELHTRAYRGPTLDTDHNLLINQLIVKVLLWRTRVPVGELKRIKNEKLQDQ